MSDRRHRRRQHQRQHRSRHPLRHLLLLRVLHRKRCRHRPNPLVRLLATVTTAILSQLADQSITSAIRCNTISIGATAQIRAGCPSEPRVPAKPGLLAGLAMSKLRRDARAILRLFRLIPRDSRSSSHRPKRYLHRPSRLVRPPARRTGPTPSPPAARSLIWDIPCSINSILATAVSRPGWQSAPKVQATTGATQGLILSKLRPDARSTLRLSRLLLQA